MLCQDAYDIASYLEPSSSSSSSSSLILRWIQSDSTSKCGTQSCHGDVIKWKYFPRYWPFVRGIHRSPVNSPLKDQWRGALMFSLICAWMNGWENTREAGHHAHYDATVMLLSDGCFSVKPGARQSMRITSVQVFLGRSPTGLSFCTFFSQPFLERHFNSYRNDSLPCLHRCNGCIMSPVLFYQQLKSQCG